MKTLKQFTLLLAVIVASTIFVSACAQGEVLAGAITGFAILFAASHSLTSWRYYRPGIFSAELTFPFDRAGAPVGAKIDQGCLSCPTGYAYTSDVALATLERVTNNILKEGVKDWRMPGFPLAGLPVRQATAQQMTGNRKIRHHVFYPNVHRNKWYSPTPNPQTFDNIQRLVQQCGADLATARLIANANSIGCAPPRGPRGLSGKDAMFQDSATTVFELGPFCVTDYLELMEFQLILEAYKRAAINAAGMSLEYEKMRRFVSMSKVNGVAIAGTTRPRFSSTTFDAIPNSPGSLEWLANAIDTGIGGEIPQNAVVEVSVSSQLFQYWLEKFKKDHDIVMNLDIANFSNQIKGYITTFDNEGGFTIKSRRTNRTIKITTSKEPVYVEISKSAGSAAEWDFQPYFVTELGDDPDTTQANGYRQSMNTAYGDGCNYCNGETKRLAEMIFIHLPSAFHYEAFPTNPLGTQIASDVEVNLQRLWGATEIMWHFGVEVDEYYLKPMNQMLADTGAPCFSNIDRTWFAGRIKTGLQFVEDDPRQMMTLLVAVPGNQVPIEKSECCLPCEPPAPITLARRPGDDPKLCDDIPAGVSEDSAPVGCMRAPVKLTFQLPCSENSTVGIVFERREGSNGALTVPYTIVDGTATEGAGADKTFLRADGNIVFADGETEKQVDFVLHPFVREPGDPKFLSAIMRIDNAPAVLCDTEEAVVDINLCFIQCDQIAPEADTCPTAYCLECEGQALVPAEALMALAAKKAESAKAPAAKRGRPAKKAAKASKPTETDINPYQPE